MLGLSWLLVSLLVPVELCTILIDIIDQSGACLFGLLRAAAFSITKHLAV